MRLKSFWSSSSVVLCRRRRRRLDQEKRAFFSGRAATLLRVDFMLRETKGTRLAFFFPSHPISKRSTRDVTALSKEEEEEEDQSTQNRDTGLFYLWSRNHTKDETFFSRRRRRRKKRMRRADETTTRSYGRSKQPRETTLRWDLGSKKDRDGVSKGEKKSVSKQRVLDVESSFFFR